MARHHPTYQPTPQRSISPDSLEPECERQACTHAVLFIDFDVLFLSPGMGPQAHIEVHCDILGHVSKPTVGENRVLTTSEVTVGAPYMRKNRDKSTIHV